MNRRTLAKIAAGYIAVVALVGAVGAVGLGTIERARGEMKVALEDQWRTVSLAAEARDLTSINARLTVSVFLMEDQGEIDTALRWRAQNTESITAILAQLEVRLTEATERDAFAEIRSHRRAYVDSYMRALDLLTSPGRTDEARRVMAHETTPRLVEYQQAWRDFVNNERRRMDAIGESALAVYERRSQQLAVLTFAALAAAIIIAGLTVRHLLMEARRRRAVEEKLANLNCGLEQHIKSQTDELLAANVELETSLEEVRATTAALQESEARYRMVFEGSEDAMVTLEPPEWRITSSNSAAQRLFGVPGGTGVRPWELSPDRQPDGAPSREGALAMIETAVANGSHYFEWTFRRVDATEFPATVLLTRMRLGQAMWLHATIRNIAAEKSIELSQRRIATAVANAAESVVITDLEGRIQYVNPAFERLSGYSFEEVAGNNPRVLKSGLQPAAVYETMWKTISGGKAWSGRLINRSKAGALYHEDVTISPVRAGDKTIAYVAVKRDITREVALEGQLLHEGKLAAVGQLASGIAHEINTPTQFVSDSIHFLSDSTQALVELVDTYHDLAATMALNPATARRIEEAEDRADLAYLRENMPRAFETSRDGLQRIATIVRAMKDFSHPGLSSKAPADLNHALESTLTIAANTYKYVAEVERDFGEIPLVSCNLADINQVFLNLVVNAAQAIEEVVGATGKRGLISVCTRLDGGHVSVKISDTGTGIPAAVHPRIFEPFFTTKPVGKGTGQGLAIARNIIVHRHGGTLTFTSEVGRGSAFVVTLPVAGGHAGEISG